MKRNYEKLLKNFPVMYNRPHPTKHDVVGLASLAWVGFKEPSGKIDQQRVVGAGNRSDESKEWKGAGENQHIEAASKSTGIFSLALDVMLSRIIGSEPVATQLPAENFVIAIPDLTDRQLRTLKREGISYDAVNAAILGLKQLAVLAPRPQTTKRQRTFVDGGILMTLPEMIESVAKVEKERKKKAADKVARAKERALMAIVEDRRTTASFSSTGGRPILVNGSHHTLYMPATNDAIQTVDLRREDASSLLLLANDTCGFNAAVRQQSLWDSMRPRH